MPYLGDFYHVPPNWAAQRTEWWNLLQRVFAGGDVAAEVAVYEANANKYPNIRHDQASLIDAPLPFRGGGVCFRKEIRSCRKPPGCPGSPSP